MAVAVFKHKIVNLIGDVRLSDYNYHNLLWFNSRKSMKKAIKRGRVLVNGRKAQTSTWLQLGDEITVLEDETDDIPPYHLDLKVVFEDDYLAVVEKPSGLITSGNRHRTLENACLSILIPSSHDESLKRFRPAHRLDAPTSGLVVMAKTSSVLNQLNRMMKLNTIMKRYLALVSGQVLKQTINLPIDGKRSISHIDKCIPIESNKYGPLSLLSVLIDTGRTHQIRIHLSSIGHPVAGDKMYNQYHSAEVKGLMLHAYELEFEHPVTYDIIKLKTDIPKRFIRFGIDEMLFETHL